MSPATRAAGAVTGTLALTGVLASVALGDSCAVAVRWKDVVYEGHVARYATPGRTASFLGEGEIPDCGTGGRCAPPEEEVEVFSLTGVPVDVAIAAPGLEAEPLVFLAPGTFPALPDHPLHDAMYGSPAKPNYRQRCGEAFGFGGEVTQANGTLRMRVADPVPEQLEEDDDGQVWLELDATSRVEGFDRNGIATIAEGEQVTVTARLCEARGEPAGLLVDVLRPG
jgi:hypothetical protein